MPFIGAMEAVFKYALEIPPKELGPHEKVRDAC